MSSLSKQVKPSLRVKRLGSGVSTVATQAGCYYSTVMFLAALVAIQLCQCIKLSVGIEHDMSGPTYGLEGKSSSQLRYDDRHGLSLAGTIGDILGPPIKIANGFGNLFHGSNMAGLGASLRGGGALLGFDAKALEAAGAGNLMKGGILWRGSQAKANAAANIAGPKGQKIASILEVPVKVVAMKDVAAGNMLTGAGQFKHGMAHSVDSKGQALMAQGQALKSQGISQIVQGANEGVTNIGNMFQKTSENINSAIRLAPLVWDMQKEQYTSDAAAKGQQQQQQLQQPIEQQQIQQQQQQLVSVPHQMSSAPAHYHGATGLTGGSFFGGLSSLLPGITSGTTSGGSSGGPNHGYAALWNATSPLTNLLMSSNGGVSPFLLPLTNGPLGQAFVAKQPIGTHESAATGGPTATTGQMPLGLGIYGPAPQSMSYNFNLIPGLKYTEHISSSAPTLGLLDKSHANNGAAVASKTATEQQQQQQQQQVQAPQPAVQQQTQAS